MKNNGKLQKLDVAAEVWTVKVLWTRLRLAIRCFIGIANQENCI